MNSGASTRLEAAACSRLRSSALRYPARNFWLSTRAVAHSIRVSSDSFDISSEKTATVRLTLLATCCAIFSASAVLPMDGRAARMNRSPACSPLVFSSSLVNPVLMPLTRLLGSRKAFSPPWYSSITWRGLTSPLRDAILAQFEQRLFGARQDFVGVFFAHEAAVHEVLRGEDDPPQDGFILDDADVGVDIQDLRQAVVERNQVAEAVAGFQLVEAHQLVGHRDPVDALAALVQLAHAGEDAAVFFEAEIVGLEFTGGLYIKAIVEQDGAEHETLGIDVAGQALIEGYGSR